MHFVIQALSDGIDVNERHPLGWTALQAAAINGKGDAVKFLIEKGADLNAGDNFINVYKTAMQKGLHTIEGIPDKINYYYLWYKLINNYIFNDK